MVATRVALRRAWVLLLILLSGCAAQSTGDAALARLLVGRWSEVVQLHEERAVQTIVLDADGSMRVAGVRHTGQGEFPYRYGGPWHVEDGIFQWTLAWAEPAGRIPIGRKYAERIDSVSPWEWIVFEFAYYRQSRRWRIPE